MTTPVRHGVELDAVGELHLVCFVQLADLQLRPRGSLLCLLVATALDAHVINEFEGLDVVVCEGSAERNTTDTTPPSCQPCRGLRIRTERTCRAAYVGFRGGIRWRRG